jgi:hypothetical protein
MRAPDPTIRTAWSSGGTVYVLAHDDKGRCARPLTVREACDLHQLYLRDLLDAAKRRETATVDALKRFETDLREAIYAGRQWRRAAGAAA